MDYYIDIKIIPSQDNRESSLLSKVYTKFHQVLVQLKADSIGVSFPEFQLKLGKVIRLHGSFKNLDELNSLNWLGDLESFCRFGNIEKAPEECKFRKIYRKQSNMSQAKLKRLIKRKSISQDEIKRYRIEMLKKGLDNPFIDLISSSTGQIHRRFFEFGEILDKPTSGKFDTFGLSKDATIPWF